MNQQTRLYLRGVIWSAWKRHVLCAHLLDLESHEEASLQDLQTRLQVSLLDIRLLIEDLETAGLVVRKVSLTKVALSDKGRRVCRRKWIGKSVGLILAVLGALASLYQILDYYKTP